MKRLCRVCRQSFVLRRKPVVNPILAFTIAMPDDCHPPIPRGNPEDIDLGAIKADFEFLIERVERFRREQALKPVYAMVGSAAIVIAWIELFWRHCL